MFGVALAIAAVIAVRSIPPAWRRVTILYWQRQAMKYAPAADRIVYDDDPNDAAKLRAGGRSLVRGAGGEAFEFARPWDKLYPLLSPPGRQPAATLFLHERTNAWAERRLVVVELRPTAPLVPGRFASLKTFQVVVMAPGTLLDDPRERTGVGSGLVIGARRTLDDVTLWYAGQPDPQDASHFTIRGLRNGVPVTVDGWLRGDQVDLSEGR